MPMDHRGHWATMALLVLQVRLVLKAQQERRATKAILEIPAHREQMGSLVPMALPVQPDHKAKRATREIPDRLVRKASKASRERIVRSPVQRGKQAFRERWVQLVRPDQPGRRV